MTNEIIRSDAARSDIVRIDSPEAGLVGGTLSLGAVLDSPTPSPNSSNMLPEQSPTYRRDKTDACEGATLPVYYGEVAFFPQVIGYYIDVDTTNNKLVAHFLFCIAEGETNLAITEDDIYLDDLLLTSFNSDSYTLQANVGTNFPASSSFITSLLHFDGADQSTTFTDESGKIWTRSGSPVIDTSDFKFGIAAGFFVSASDQYIQTPAHTNFDVGSGDFTVHCWVNKVAVLGATYQAIFGQSNSAETDFSIICRYSNISTGDVVEVLFQDDNSTPTTYTISGAIVLADDIWNHVAIVRSTNIATLYINGIADGTVDLTGVTINPSTNKMGIGIIGEVVPDSITESLDGRVEEFCFQKGFAEWTDDFPVPSAPCVFGAFGIFTDKFTNLHQYTNYDKRLFQSETTGIPGNITTTLPMSSLIHYDASPIEEETQEVHGWTLSGGATISASTPKFGASCLDLTSASSFSASTNGTEFDLLFKSGAPVKTEWDIEMFFEFNTASEVSALIGHESAFSGSDGYAWGLFVVGGILQFQAFRIESGMPTDVIYDVQFDTIGSAAGSADEFFTGIWYHVRVCSDLLGVVRIFVDGDLKVSGTQTVPTWTFSGAATTTNRIGWGKRKEASSIVAYFGDGRVDEFRMLNGGLLRDASSNFTAPTAAYTYSLGKIFTTVAEVDGFAIIVNAKNGLFFENDDNSLSSVTISLKIFYREVGDTTWIISNHVITGTTTEPFGARFEFDVSTSDVVTGRKQYEMMISRLTEDKTSRHGSSTWLIGIDEILEETLAYPNAQCIALSLEAQDEFSGRIPHIRTVARRTLISAPTFDGTDTQLVDPTNNMYAAFDILTNTLYGAGFDPTNIVELDWDTTWKDYCDGIITGTIKRCTFNFLYDSNYDLLKALQFVESSSRAKIINKGMKLGVIIDQPGTATYIFNTGNTMPEQSNLTFLQKLERSDAVEVLFIDSAQNWTEQPFIHRSDNFENLTTTPRIVKIDMRMINTKERAQREAIFRQQLSEDINRAISLQSGLEAIANLKGDIVSFRHPGNTKAFDGRIDRDASGSDTYTGTTIYLDQAITLDTATFSGNAQVKTINKTTDVITTHTITGPFDIETNAFVVSVSATFNRFEPYILGRITGEIYDYKVSSTQRTTKQSVRIEAVQYTPGSYTHADFDNGGVTI